MYYIETNFDFIVGSKISFSIFKPKTKVLQIVESDVTIIKLTLLYMVPSALKVFKLEEIESVVQVYSLFNYNKSAILNFQVYQMIVHIT